MAKTGHNGHRDVTETPDVSHIKNIDVTHEVSDVNVPALLKFVLALTVMTIVVYVLMWLLFKFFNAQLTQKEPPPGPMAMSEQERLPPEPRLQGARGFGVKLEDGQWVSLEKALPQAEYRVLHEQWEQRLNCKNDKGIAVDIPALARGVPCVPIDEAIKKVLEQGLPSRSQQDAPPGREEYSVTTPTAASSGRVGMKEKR